MALAVFVIAGLAAATMSTVRANQAAAEIGTPERALHEALQRISHDLRTNNGSGTYRCGRNGTLDVNGSTVRWRTNSVTIRPAGGTTNQSSCGSLSNQRALRVLATTTDVGATHQRETIVSLAHGTTPTIASFTANRTNVRPDDAVTLSWRLNPNPPAGTTTLINGQRVTTNPDTLRGNVTVHPQETTTYTLTADSPNGSSDRDVTIVVGAAPIFQQLRSNPPRYTPGEPITLSWRIDPRPLAFQGGNVATPSGIPNINIGSSTSSSGIATGSRTITTPSGASGTLDFLFAARSAGGESKRTLRVQECPVPDVTIQSSSTRIDKDGRISRDITISWTTTHAETAVFKSSRRSTEDTIASADVANGSRSEHVSVSEGNRRTYTYTLTATSDCGRSNSASVTVVLDSDEDEDSGRHDDDDADDDDDDDSGVGSGGEGGGGDDGGWELTCRDLDWDPLYCACFSGPRIQCI